MPHACDFCGSHEDPQAATAWRATADRFRRNANELREQRDELLANLHVIDECLSQLHVPLDTRVNYAHKAATDAIAKAEGNLVTPPSAGAGDGVCPTCGREGLGPDFPHRVTPPRL